MPTTPGHSGGLDWREHRFPSGAVYRGSFLEECKEGRGWWRHPRGETYQGEYHANRQHGWGTYLFPDSGKQYHGQWARGEMHGRGVYVFTPDWGELFVGTYAYDRKHGQGLYQYANDGRVAVQIWNAGEITSERDATPLEQFEYFAEMMDIIEMCNSVGRNPSVVEAAAGSSPVEVAREFDLRLDHRAHTFPSGARYEGHFLHTKKQGSGVWQHPDGDWYDGQFTANRPEGWGVYVIGGSEKKFVGAWKGGQMNGWGVYFFTPEENEYYIGRYSADLKTGIGLYVFASGSARVQRWDSGEMMDDWDADERTRALYESVKQAVLRKVDTHCARFKPRMDPPTVSRIAGVGL